MCICLWMIAYDFIWFICFYYVLEDVWFCICVLGFQWFCMNVYNYVLVSKIVNELCTTCVWVYMMSSDCQCFCILSYDCGLCVYDYFHDFVWFCMHRLWMLVYYCWLVVYGCIWCVWFGIMMLSVLIWLGIVCVWLCQILHFCICVFCLIICLKFVYDVVWLCISVYNGEWFCMLLYDLLLILVCVFMFMYDFILWFCNNVVWCSCMIVYDLLYDILMILFWFFFAWFCEIFSWLWNYCVWLSLMIAYGFVFLLLLFSCWMIFF